MKKHTHAHIKRSELYFISFSEEKKQIDREVRFICSMLKRCAISIFRFSGQNEIVISLLLFKYYYIYKHWL